MRPPALLPPDLLEAVAATCVKCWRAARPLPPPAELDDYRLALKDVMTRQYTVAGWAWDDGCEGTLNDLQRTAHREAYIRSGSPADLIKMLRHVTPDDEAARAPGTAVTG